MNLPLITLRKCHNFDGGGTLLPRIVHYLDYSTPL